MLYEQLLPPSTILLIEADPSLRRLMTLGLQHNGLHVIDTSSLYLASITAQSIDLLVLDVDCGMANDWSLLEKIQSNPQLASLPIVVLAWDYPGITSTTIFTSPTAFTSIVVSNSSQVLLNKPFDARALYRIVQRLLVSRAEQKAAIEALAEARVLAMYSQHAAPSIWPVVTAAGMLLAVIGLLFHVAIAITGMLIVVVALLLWTLGAKPEAAPMPVRVGWSHNS
jgi:CheY-like chemotaxis protein